VTPASETVCATPTTHAARSHFVRHDRLGDIPNLLHELIVPMAIPTEQASDPGTMEMSKYGNGSTTPGK
jgi:hypothetical protein